MKNFFSLQGRLSLTSLLIFSVAFFAACSSDMDGQPTGPAANSNYIQLTFVQEPFRASINQDGSGTFIEGDEIGLYIDNGTVTEYRILKYTNSEWLPKLKRSDFGSGQLKLSAHFPAIPASVVTDPTNYGFQIGTSQHESDFSASDILFSQTLLNEGSYQAVMLFQHIMHRLQITFNGNNSNTNVIVRSKTAGNINLLTGETTVPDSDFQWITPKNTGDGTYEAIIYPQPASPYRDDEEGLLKISSPEK